MAKQDHRPLLKITWHLRGASVQRISRKGYDVESAFATLTSELQRTILQHVYTTTTEPFPNET